MNRKPLESLNGEGTCSDSFEEGLWLLGYQKVGGIAVAITGHGETKEQMECYKALHVIEPCRTKYTHAHVHTQLGRRGSVSGFDI